MALNNCSNAHLSSLARGFGSPTMIKLLGPQILCYILWQKNFLMMKEMSISGDLRGMTVDDYGVSSSMVHRADYHLLTLPFLTELSPLRNLVRLVLLISDMSTFIGLRSGTTYVCMSRGAVERRYDSHGPGLTERISRLRLSAWYSGRAFMVWS